MSDVWQSQSYLTAVMETACRTCLGGRSLQVCCFQNLRGFERQRIRNAHQIEQSHIAFAPLNLSHVGPIDLGEVG